MYCDLSARNYFQAAQQRFSLLATVGLDNANDNVIAVLFARLGLLQHLVGLADARCGAHKNSQLANAPLFAARRFEERLGRGPMFSVAPGICHRVEYYQIGRPETWVFETWPFETWPFETWPFETWPFETWPFEIWPFETWPFETWGFGYLILTARIGPER